MRRGEKWLNVGTPARGKNMAIELSSGGRYGSVWARPLENLFKSCSLSSTALSECGCSDAWAPAAVVSRGGIS